MLNLSQETKAVLPFGSVYRLRPLSSSTCSVWVKWHSEPTTIYRILKVPEADLYHVVTAVALLTAGCVRLWREAAEMHCPSTKARIPGWLLDHSLGEQCCRGGCGASLCHGVGKEVITRSSVPQSPRHKLTSFRSAFLASICFIIQCKEKSDWSHIRGPYCNLLSERVTGSLRNNGINWGEVGPLSFWHY